MTSKVLYYFLQLVDPVVSIHLGDVFSQLIAVSFREATHDEHMAEFALFFGLNVLKDGVDGFLFRIPYETTGIDDHGVKAFYRGGIEGDFKVAGIQLFLQEFGINEIFGTTKGNDPDMMRPGPGFQPD